MGNFEDIRAFIAVAKSGSFSDAALALGLHKSSCSRSVRRLEEDLGRQLFKRSSRNVELTEFGRYAYSSCSQAVSVLDEFLGVGNADQTTSTVGGISPRVQRPHKQGALAD